MAKNLTDYKVLTFDCYGTLIDWESGIWDALQPLYLANGYEGTRVDGLAVFGEVEHQHETETPDLLYPELLKHVHVDIAKHLGLKTTDDLDVAFGNSVPHWPAFPDSADALRVLKRYYKLVILSNVNRDGFAASNKKLGVEFDAIYTAEDVGSYKPNPANFEYMLSHLKSDLGLNPKDVLHTAQSLLHDHVQAKAFGLANAWVDRQGLSKGGHWGATKEVKERPQMDFIFSTLEEMAEAIKSVD